MTPGDEEPSSEGHEKGSGEGSWYWKVPKSQLPKFILDESVIRNLAGVSETVQAQSMNIAGSLIQL
jgi:hypothetical protein